jgi:hypothetical protein
VSRLLAVGLLLASAAAPAAAQVSAPTRAHPATTLVQPAPVVIPIVLPPPPRTTSQAGSTLISALLSIANAQRIDPRAAQTASFQYVQAVQQYRSGNFAAAKISALAALSTAAQAQVENNVPAPVPPNPALVSGAGQLPGLAGGLYGGDAPAIDADAFLALARGTIDDCAARRDRRLGAAESHYDRAKQDFSRRDWEAARIDAKAAIDACAKPQP